MIVNKNILNIKFITTYWYFFESINIKFLPINIYLKLKNQLITILTKNCFNKSKKLVLKIKQLYLSIINLRLIIDKYSISNSDTLKKLKKILPSIIQNLLFYN